MPTLEDGGKTLSYQDDGAGTVALLLHSGGLSSRQWRGLASQLKTKHRVLAPDLLGYGGSTPLADGAGFHFRDDVEMLQAMLEKLAPDQAVHLVGHSYGGLLALQLALKAPHLARSFALFEPVAFGLLHKDDSVKPDSAELIAMEAMASDDSGAGGGEAWMEGFVDWWQGKGLWRTLPEPSRTAFLAAGRKTFLEVKSLLADRTPASAYRVLQAPALILSGEKSPAVEQRVCARLATALPNGKLEIVAKAGHMGPLTHMSQVNSLIAAHLAANDFPQQS